MIIFTVYLAIENGNKTNPMLVCPLLYYYSFTLLKET